MPEQKTDIVAPEVQSISLGSREKVYLLIALLAIVIVCHVPFFFSRLIFVEEVGISTSDVFVFIISPFLCYLLMILIPVLAGRLKPQLVGFNLRWFAGSRREVILSILLTFVTFAAGVGIAALVRKAGFLVEKPIFYGGMPYSSLAFVLARILSLALLAPIFEEIFYRGYLQSHFERVIGPRIAWVAQAFVFTIFHFRPLGGSLPVLAYGLIFGFWRYKRRTLLPVIIAHIAVNSVFCAVFWSDMVELREIKVTTNYVAQYNEASKPQDYNANDNAAHYYAEACELAVEMPRGLEVGDVKLWPEDLPEEKRATLEEWVADNEEAIKALELGTRQSYWWVEHYGEHMSEVVLPGYLGNAKTLTYAILSRAKLNAVEGSFRQTFSDVLMCYRFGLHAVGPKSLVEQLVGVAICGLTTRSSFQILERKEIPVDVLRDFQLQLEKTLSDQQFIIDFTGDRLYFYDQIQRTFTDDGAGSGRIPGASIRAAERVPDFWRALGIDPEQVKEAGWDRLDRRETVQVGDKVFDYLDRLSVKTLAQLRREGEDFEAKLEQITEGNSLVAVFVPACTKVFEIANRAKAHTEALIVTTAVLGYKEDKGGLPETLEELTETGYLTDLPMDPFGDGPLVYRKVGDDFTVYSVGADFEDDNGTGNGRDGGDYVFWPPQAVN